MNTGSIILEEQKITYHRWGKGPRLLLCFHGYGESGRHFGYLAAAMPEGWSVIAPDLPFHGETEWTFEKEFNPAILVKVLQLLLEKEKLQFPATFMGYSIGGRIALHLYQQYPALVNAISLIAPDGLHENFWYRIATQSNYGNKLFSYTMRHPGWFKGLALAGVKLQLVNPSANKFIQRYMHDPHIRNELYTRWTAMRHFRPVVSQLKDQLKKEHTPVLLVYGKHDRIITHLGGEKLRKGLEENVQLMFLPAGHQLLQPTFVKVIADATVALPRI